MGKFSEALNKHCKENGQKPSDDRVQNRYRKLFPEDQALATAGAGSLVEKADEAPAVLNMPEPEIEEAPATAPPEPEKAPAREGDETAAHSHAAAGTAGAAQENRSPAPADPHLVVLSDPYSFEAEQFKTLRSTLLFPVSGKVSRSILVTSTEPGEGKTFVAANLAASIALNLDKHVLLLDCDLRKPHLHQLFGLEDNLPGLGDYLAQGRPLPELLVKTALPRLTLLLSGQAPLNPSELLSSEKMFRLLEEVKNRYKDRFIIIDSPPALFASESNGLAQASDGILLVVKHRGPRRDDVLDVVQKLGKDKILGTFVNWGSKRASGYYYRAKKYGYSYSGNHQKK